MIALLAGVAWAAVHEVEVAPAEVTVFADRARVTRTARLDLPSGRQEVQFTGLPASMQSQGVTGDATGPGVLRGIDLKRVTASEIADRRVNEIAGELERLQDERQQAIDDATAAQATIAVLGAGRAQSAQALNHQMLVGDDAPRQATALRTSMSAEEARAREAWRKADLRRRGLDDRIASLQRERDTLGSQATDTWTAVVHLEMERAGRVEVDLSYLVSGATWTPRYDLRGDAAKGKVELALSAMVQQTTGEDWEDVALTVSSARPSLGTDVPELDPFWLQRPQYYPAPSAASSGGARSSAKPSSMADSAPAPPREAAPMQVAQATVQIQLAATAFTVARPEDVPADGTERKVGLTTKSLDADLRHVIVPRLDPRAYLVGEAENTAGFPLLAGTAGVFLEGAYLGDFQMPLVAPGEKFDVAFGVDDRVTVKRTPVQIEEGKTGLAGKRATSRWSWIVTVKSAHPRPIQAVVWEQVPVSTREDVQVTLRPSTPTPKAEDGGKLRFDVTVPAGGEARIAWGYDVQYPADLQLGWLE